jgi:hypothetical protein
VSQLVETIIVRDGFTTRKWVESGDKTLVWREEYFASSNADLSVLRLSRRTALPNRPTASVVPTTMILPGIPGRWMELIRYPPAISSQ